MIVLGLSTGATLAALGARDPHLGPMMDGVILLSPNVALRARGARVLDLPGLRPVLRWVGDPQRCFAVRNDRHRAGWTACYPLSALLPVGALLRAARRGDYRRGAMPALFVWADDDRIIDHRASERVASGWGGAVTIWRVRPGPGDDPDRHVLAGEALSPGATAGMTRAIAGWIERLD